MTRVDLARYSDLGAGQLLAVHQYARGSDGAVGTTTSSTSADVDATNAAITFTVPASGNVIVEIEAMDDHYTTLGIVYWQLRESSSVIAEARMFQHDPADGTKPQRCSARWLITGLTPGASKTYKMGHRVSAGSNDILSGPLTGTFGPIILTVMAAP